jgi:hypothetical protein
MIGGADWALRGFNRGERVLANDSRSLRNGDPPHPLRVAGTGAAAGGLDSSLIELRAPQIDRLLLRRESAVRPLEVCARPVREDAVAHVAGP